MRRIIKPRVSSTVVCPITDLETDVEEVCEKLCECRRKGKCDFYEYRTRQISSRDEHESDEYFGMPDSTYWFTIKCAKCKNRIEFCSGLSSFTQGMMRDCPKCGLNHYFKKHIYHTKSKDTLLFITPSF